MEQQGRLALLLLLLLPMTLRLPCVTHAQQRAVNSVAAAGGGLHRQAAHVAAGGQHGGVCGRTRGIRNSRSKCRHAQRASVQQDWGAWNMHSDGEWEAEWPKQGAQASRPPGVTARPAADSPTAATAYSVPAGAQQDSNKQLLPFAPNQLPIRYAARVMPDTRCTTRDTSTSTPAVPCACVHASRVKHHTPRSLRQRAPPGFAPHPPAASGTP